PTSGDRMLGTQLQPGATARWHYQAAVPLTPAQVAFLLDRTRVTEVRNTLHTEIRPRVQGGNGQPDTVNNVFCQLLQPGTSGNATNVSITITPPTGLPVQFTATTTPGLASIAPGASVTVSTPYTVPAVAS